MHAVETFELILLLLALVVVLYWVALKLGMPPSTVLLVGGGALAFVPGLPEIQLDPELALVLFLPPLLVDGAFYTAISRFRRHIIGILSLAVGAIVFTTLAVGVVTHWLVPQLPWAVCFALGAIVSPPDAVSARAVLKRVTIPRRLTTLLEGESLLNDATGLILFRFAVAAALTGAFDAVQAVQSFAVLALGGVAVGLALGAAWVFVVRKLKERLLVISATVLLSWLAYLAGEAVHVSGVISTVVAGLVQGWYQHTELHAGVRLQSRSVSEMISFILEALVFILIGFSLRGVIDRIGSGEGLSEEMALAVLAVVLTVTLARFVWVFAADAMLALAHRLKLRNTEPLGWRQATVLSWAGMRGVVTLAIALTVPIGMPGRDLILVSAFAVILVTVIVQGWSFEWLIRVIRPVDKEPAAPVPIHACELAISRARTDAVAGMVGADGAPLYPMLLTEHQRRLEFTERYAERGGITEEFHPHLDAMLASNAAGRRELIRLHREGQIEDEVLHNLERDLDVEEMMITFQRPD